MCCLRLSSTAGLCALEASSTLLQPSVVPRKISLDSASVPTVQQPGENSAIEWGVPEEPHMGVSGLQLPMYLNNFFSFIELLIGIVYKIMLHSLMLFYSTEHKTLSPLPWSLSL